MDKMEMVFWAMFIGTAAIAAVYTISLKRYNRTLEKEQKELSKREQDEAKEDDEHGHG